MNKKKPITSRMKPTRGKRKSDKAKSSSSENFEENIQNHPDFGVGMDMTGEYAGVVFDVESGGKIKRLEQDDAELTTRFGSSLRHMNALEKKVQDTPEYKKSAPERSGTDSERIGFLGWRGRDQLAAAMALIMTFAAMVLGSSNVYSNLMGSGNAAFIENHWLAVSLSMMLPIGSTSLKFVTNFIQLNVWRARYILFIYILLALLLILWGVLFGLSFNGAGGGINWDTLGQSSSKDTALVWVQLLIEILAATALYLAFEEIAMRYAPDSWVKSAEYYEVSKEYKDHFAAHEKLRKQCETTEKRLVSLRAAREKKIIEATAHYVAMRSTNHPKFDQ